MEEHAFARVPDASRDHLVLTLGGGSANELAVLACLSPCMTTSLKASYVQHVGGTDAAPGRSAAVQARVPEAVSRELWRARERRGHYTWLCGRERTDFAADARADDIDDFEEQLHQQGECPRRVLVECFDLLLLPCAGAPGEGLATLRCTASTTDLRRLGPRLELPVPDRSHARRTGDALHQSNGYAIWPVSSVCAFLGHRLAGRD